MHRVILAAAAILFFFIVNIPSASAAWINLSNDLKYAESFSFYCNPYISSFEAGRHYMGKNGFCTYSIPSTLTPGNKQILLMKGIPGVDAAIKAVEYGNFGPVTLLGVFTHIFDNAVVDDDYFAAIYDATLDQNATPLLDYLSGATSTLPAGVIEGQNFFILPWKWGPTPVEELRPVIIVPGILGSWEKDGKWLVDPILHTYDNLADTLLANGYVEGQTLFRFGYNWRQSNIITAELLGNKIQEVKTICGCSKVNIIAHSMGGLVAERYVESPDYQQDIDWLVLMSVPQVGAPEAYKTWEGGEFDFGNIVKNMIVGAVFHLEALQAGYSSIFDYIQGRPINSVQELLPVYDYLHTATTTPHYPSRHPVNNFLENLNDNLPVGFNSFYYSLDGARLIQVTAIGRDTTSGFEVEYTNPSSGKWEHGEPTKTLLANGDGTVPTDSLLYFFGPENNFPSDDHSSVASSSSSLIFERFNNREPETLIGKKYETYDIVKSVFFLKLFSPIDMQIVAPDGKRLGKDFSNNTELSEIPDAFYSGFATDNEYAIILNPLPGEYKVITTGTGEGEYTIAAAFSDLATTTYAEVTDTTATGEVISHVATPSPTSTTITITADVPTPMEVTPKKCAEDVETAHQNDWLTKRSVYKRLLADCYLLGKLFETRDNIREHTRFERLTELLVRGVNISIKNTLDRMGKLVQDKSNTQEAKDLLNQDIQWLRENELEK